MARILGRIFAKEEIKFLYFFGNMNAAQKNGVVNAFHERPEIKILVSFRPQQQAFHANSTVLISFRHRLPAPNAAAKLST